MLGLFHSQLYRRWTAAAALGLSLLATSEAAGPATWVIETYTQFDQGDTAGAVVASSGEVRQGHATSSVALDSDAVWALASLGNDAWAVGTDRQGAILRVEGKTVKPWATLPRAIAVAALASHRGTLYATALPGRSVFAVEAGKARELATLPEKQVETIWALLADGTGALYAGTGPEGKLFRVEGGKATEVFATGDKRITALTLATDGAIWFGTSDRAMVFRYDPKNRQTRAMGDFAGNEISALASYGDGVVVAANDLAEAPSGAAKSAAQVEAAEKPSAAKGQVAKPAEPGSKPGADRDPPTVTDLGRRGAKKGKGAIFHIAGDGSLKQLHALTQTYFTSLLTHNNVIYAGAADKGRIYAIEADGTVATAFDVDERAVASLAAAGPHVVFATDDKAKLYRATGPAPDAKYVSEVFDAKAPARFGALRWQGQGKLVIQTRSGNTAKPGPGWSEWDTLKGDQGELEHAGKVASPPGRYLQLRVELGEPSARLRRVATTYLAQNQPPAIEDLTFDFPKAELPTVKETKPQTPIVKLKWRVENPDSDELVYRIFVRREGEANWRQLGPGKPPLTTATFDWNTEAYADGWYRIKVEASDELSNSVVRTSVAEHGSPPVLIDNTKPTINELEVRGGKAQAEIRDALGTIAEAAYAVDDGPWQLAAPADDIFDDASETITMPLPRGLAKGTHTLAVRAADNRQNLAAASVTFVVK